MRSELKQLGFNLREAREMKKLTREYVADRIDVHFRTLSKWENGQSDPPLGKIIEVAKVLEIPLSRLLGLDSNQVKDSFNNNQQEGETCILNSGTISFDKEAMSEINKRFAFLESLILTLQNEKSSLLKALEKKREGND